jgi:Rieske 2Fe-2S family protein
MISSPDDLAGSIKCFSQSEYISARVFEQDIHHLSSQWIWVDHVSRFPSIGSYHTHQVCNEPVILVRTECGFKAHINVCRHRGSVICTEKNGIREHFLCPYHGWSYSLDGQLLSSRGSCPPGKNAAVSLRPVAVRIYEGLIFVALEPQHACQFSALEKILDPLIPWHGLDEAKIAVEKDYVFRANWKLVVENFLECFHCFQNHPELCSVYSHTKFTGTKDPTLGREYLLESAQWEKQTRALGHPVGGVNSMDVTSPQYCVAFRMPIQPGFKSLSRTGAPLAPLMGRFQEFDGGETFGYIGPLLHLSLANDHAMLIRISPMSPVETQVHLTWLVDNLAVEGRDYDPAALIWLWDATVQQDRAAVERAHTGIQSRFFTPGYYTDLEVESARFATWYRARLSPASSSSVSR